MVIKNIIEKKDRHRLLLDKYLKSQKNIFSNLLEHMDDKEAMEYFKEMDMANDELLQKALKPCNLTLNKSQLHENTLIPAEKMVSKPQISDDVKSSAEKSDIKRFFVSLKEKPLAAEKSYHFPKEGEVLVFGDKSKEIQAFLQTMNLTAINVDYSADEDYFENLDYNNIVGCIALDHPTCETVDDLGFIRSVFLASKHLSKDVFFKKQGHFFIVATTSDGKFSFDKTDQMDVKGSISGLVKSVNIEWGNNVRMKYFNFHKALQLHQLLPLIKEDTEKSDIVEAAYDGNNVRYEYLLDEITPKQATAKSVPNENDVFLATGGAGGVTSECLKKLIQQHKPKFILLGRTNLDIEDKFKGLTSLAEVRQVLIDENAASKTKKKPAEIEQIAKTKFLQLESIRNLDEIKSYGCGAVYYQCDVNNEQDVKNAIMAGEKELGKITGIVHGAGIISDKFVRDKTFDDFKRVFDCKYQGINNMIKHVDCDNLRFIVLFSSAAGYFGNRGQSDYATANEYLNIFSKWFNHHYPNCNTISINWGAWDGGMVDPALRKIMRMNGVKLIPLHVGAQYFIDTLEKEQYMDRAQIVVNFSDKWDIGKSIVI